MGACIGHPLSQGMVSPIESSSGASSVSAMCYVGANNIHLRLIFDKWRACAERALAARRLELAHTRLAELHQRLADNEATVQNALRLIRDVGASPSPAQGERARGSVCVVCLSDDRPTSVCDANEHHVCDECLGKLCDIASREATPPGQIPCPCTDDVACAGVFTGAHYGRMEAGRRLLCEWQHRRAMETACELLGRLDRERFQVHARYLRADGSFAARQCSRCGFGPIEHTRCDDLREFHFKQGFANECPKCRHFEDRASAWPEWRGD